MAPLEITGNVRDRFIQATVLLHMLDPVRGEPSEHSLDRDSPGDGIDRPQMLQRKFLDSIALLCATQKDGDTVTAACMEEGSPEGTIIRVASNAGLSASILSLLQSILDDLNHVAGSVFDKLHIENTILQKILVLNKEKILSYLENICSLRKTRPELEQELSIATPDNDLGARQISHWYREIANFETLCSESDPNDFAQIVNWALEARSFHLPSLEAALPATPQSAKWIRTIQKVSRYGITPKVLVRLALVLPKLFVPMRIEPIEAPEYVMVCSGGGSPLSDVLKRSVGPDSDHYFTRLAAVWNSKDPETKFRTACSLRQRVHAEMQLIDFYDHNPHLRPSLRFIGVSKKSCFLCHAFLTIYPENFSTSSCHQKLYTSWRAPPATKSEHYRKRKELIKVLCKTLESTIRNDLKYRLKSPKRMVPPDSTAGVSLFGVTTSKCVSEARQKRRARAENNPGSTKTATPVSNTDEGSVWSAQFPTPESNQINDAEEISGYHGLESLKPMVFHFTRPSDLRQEIVSTADISDGPSSQPSWRRLVEALTTEYRNGIGFDEFNEYMMFNGQIRVTNERQFLACVQYLSAKRVLASDVTVHSYSGG